MTPLATVLDIEGAIRETWRIHGTGHLSDSEAEQLVAALETHRPASSSGPLRQVRAPLVLNDIRRFAPRRYQCSPDREASRRRRRMLARDGHMPPQVRSHYTEGEASALTIIATEFIERGMCDAPIDKIAALAGVCRTTVQNAMREAARLGHVNVERRPVPGKRSLTNRVRIVSREWLAWLQRGQRTGFKTSAAAIKIFDPTKTDDGGGGGGPAKKLAKEVAEICGLKADPLTWPPGWCDVVGHVQGWLSAGFHPEAIKLGVRAAMASDARRREGPPGTPAYFDRPIKQVIEQVSRPLPNYGERPA
jgi:hypothetical protein